MAGHAVINHEPAPGHFDGRPCDTHLLAVPHAVARAQYLDTSGDALLEREVGNNIGTDAPTDAVVEDIVALNGLGQERSVFVIYLVGGRQHGGAPSVEAACEEVLDADGRERSLWRVYPVVGGIGHTERVAPELIDGVEYAHDARVLTARIVCGAPALHFKLGPRSVDGLWQALINVQAVLRGGKPDGGGIVGAHRAVENVGDPIEVNCGWVENIARLEARTLRQEDGILGCAREGARGLARGKRTQQIRAAYGGPRTDGVGRSVPDIKHPVIGHGRAGREDDTRHHAVLLVYLLRD